MEVDRPLKGEPARRSLVNFALRSKNRLFVPERFKQTAEAKLKAFDPELGTLGAMLLRLSWRSRLPQLARHLLIGPFASDSSRLTRTRFCRSKITKQEDEVRTLRCLRSK
jgi:hypothetical protein